MGQNTIYIFNNIYGLTNYKDAKPQYVVYGDDNYNRLYRNICLKLDRCYKLCNVFINRLMDQPKLDDKSFSDLVWNIFSDNNNRYEIIKDHDTGEPNNILLGIENFYQIKYIIEAFVRDYLDDYENEIPFVVDSISKVFLFTLKNNNFFLLLNKPLKTAEIVVLGPRTEDDPKNINMSEPFSDDKGFLVSEYFETVRKLTNRLHIRGEKFVVFGDSGIRTLLRNQLNVLKENFSIDEYFTIDVFDFDNSGIAKINTDSNNFYSFDKLLKGDD